MFYTTERAKDTNIPKLIDYKLKTIFEYAENLSVEEVYEINSYVKKNVPLQLESYQMICIDNNQIGCVLVKNKDDGVLLDEIYIEENYRNRGIGSNIIRKTILENDVVYLWVYKLNISAISLYIKIGFETIATTETRYYMKYQNK